MPTVVVPLLDATPSYSSPSAGVPTVAFGDEAAPIYSVVVVDRGGTVIYTLTNAKPDVVTWTLNEPDEATFHFPKNAYTTGHLDVLATTGGAREIQIYRNGDLLTWGPITGINASGNSGAVSCKVNGVDWYLNRLFLDGIIENLLDNPDFEADASGTGSASNWTYTGTGTVTVSDETFVTGTRAVLLENGFAGTESFLTQSHIVSAGRLGLAVIASAWVYKDAEVEPAYETRGLYIDGIQGATVRGYNYAPIDNASPDGSVGHWVKISTYLWIPPFQTWTINIRLYSPKGAVRWDNIKLVSMQSVDAAGHDGTTLVATDIAHIIDTMITHVQSSLVGKADLHIGYFTDVTGVTLIKVWQYVDHVQFDQALHELLDRNDGCDYYVKLTPTTRVFRTFAAKRGTDLSGSITLQYDPADPEFSNCTDYRFLKDGGACITRQTMLGEDNGPTREQGEAFDATATGGAILQDVRQAPHDTHTSSLQPLADERIARYSVPPISLEVDVTGDTGYIPTIHCGDLVAVFVSDGYVVADDVYRVMRLSLNCVTNLLTVTVAVDTL